MIDDNTMFDFFRERFRNSKKYLSTFLKYSFSITITIVSLMTTGDIRFMLFSLCELAIIFLFSNVIMRFYPTFGRIFNCFCILLYNIQILVLFFGNSYLSMIMLSNISSWEALKGRIVVYCIGILLLLSFSFLPINDIKLVKRSHKVTSFLIFLILLAVESAFLMNIGTKYSPSASIYTLIQDEYKYLKILNKVKEEVNEKKKLFYNDKVEQFYSRPTDLPEKPNIVMIFTEGLSQHIIDDDRKITPNIKELQEKSLNFTEYYNHTFATYRGIIGQLYSGYQLQNSDQNHLISIQSILKQESYQTYFINTEPRNIEFTTYLNNLGFDSVINPEPSKYEDNVFDKDAYEELYELMSKQDPSHPFFISMYTFGTHIGMDSYEGKFENGNDRLLNRFHDLDNQIGKFIQKFEDSPFASNTIFVFTTDHATYVDDEYVRAFSNQNRGMGNLDKVPLFFYYKGIRPQAINVGGRNSLNIVPTILDYIDISSENYFLGHSLFSEYREENLFDTTFISELTYATTKNSQIKLFSEDEISEIEEQIVNYYLAVQ